MFGRSSTPYDFSVPRLNWFCAEPEPLPAPTTPAIHGSKYTNISCSPRKYQGAFAGFIVKFGFAGSSNGAFNVIDHTIKMIVTMIAARNSIRSRNGQTCTSFCHPGLNGHVFR
jgi:hypothetical protein